MTDNHSQATLDASGPAVMGDYRSALPGEQSVICPVDQELVLYFRNGRKEAITELEGVGMCINHETGSIGFEVHGTYADGSAFAVPQADVQAVIDRKICQAVQIPLVDFEGSSSREVVA